MTTPDKFKELEGIVIDFNIYLEAVSVGLEQLETGVQATVDNPCTEIDEFTTGTSSFISYMKKDLEQGITVITEMLKSISCLK